MFEQIKKSVEVLCVPGLVYELRCPTEKGTISGYFDNFDALAYTAESLSGTVQGVYITLNPVAPALLARANNRHKYRAKNTTGDDEITRRVLLLIDGDPNRPPGISSSNVEHDAAIQRVRQIRDYLTGLGFPPPLLADSGNGGHLVYLIDLPNDPESAELLKRFLESLSIRFDDDLVIVDRTVWNASRISKLYGTKTMKGDPTPDRPHRFSQIIETPDRLEIVPVELLRKVAGGTVDKPTDSQSKTHKSTTSSKQRQSGKRWGNLTAEDVEQMMDDRGLEYRASQTYQGGIRWQLVECPYGENHSTGPDGAAVFLMNGIVGFDCKHAHCVDIDAENVFGNVNGNSKSKESKFDKLAKEFVSDHEDRREVPLFTDGQMYFYDKNRYAACSELAMKVREFFKVRGWPQSNNIVGNVVPIVQSHAWKNSTKFGQMPFWFGDNAPFDNHKNVISFQNGLLNLSKPNDGLIAHSPNWCSTVCLPFEFDPLATCPVWRNFLNDVFEGDIERESLLQEFVGYCLSQDTSLQKALILEGKPRSGKGTCQRIIGHLVGKEAATGFTLDKLATEFGLSALVNKSVALVGEVELSGNPHRAKIVEVFKSIVGEDHQSINQKHNPTFPSVRLPTRFIVATNQLPRLMDSSGALGQRLLFVPFETSFVGREDIELESKLLAELPGIANWALEGLRRLRDNQGKFTIGGKHRKLSGEFSANTSPILAWIKSEMVVSNWANPGDLPPECIVKESVSITKDDAYKSYFMWCDDNDIERAEKRWFGRDLRNFVPKLKEGQERHGNGERIWIYKGIGIRPTVRNSPPVTNSSDETSPESVSGTVGTVIYTAGSNFFGETEIKDSDKKLCYTMKMTMPSVPPGQSTGTDPAKSRSAAEMTSPATDPDSDSPDCLSLVAQPKSTEPFNHREATRQALNFAHQYRGKDGKRWIAMPTPANLNVWQWGRLNDDGTTTIFEGSGNREWAIAQIKQRLKGKSSGHSGQTRDNLIQ